MSESKWIRARSNQQKDLRLNEILDSAADLFHTNSYDSVTMIMIAKKANFTRSNLYRYFKTKEEIFLTLYLADIRSWKEDVISNLVGDESFDGFIKIWMMVLLKQNRLLELTPLLASNLEKNTSKDIYISTKIEIVNLIEEVMPIFLGIFNNATKDQVYKILLFHQALVSGLKPMCQYSKLQEDTLNSLNLDIFLFKFGESYRESFTCYIKGLLG